MTRSSSLAVRCYSIKPRRRKMLQDMNFCHLLQNLSNKYKNQLFYTGLDSLKTASRKLRP